MNVEKAVMKLSQRSKKRVAARITKLIEDEIHSELGWTMGEYCIDVVEEILGTQIDASRTLDNVFARAVISSYLYDIGWTEKRIGELIKRNHATIHHYRVMVEDALKFPSSNPDLIWLYNKFTEKINNDGERH